MPIKASTHKFQDLNKSLIVEAVNRYISRAFLTKQVEESGVQEKRQRKLGSVLVIFFLLYQCLFRNSNRKEVLKKLVEGYQTRGWRIPAHALAGRSGISKALKRVGADVIKNSYEALVVRNKPCKESFYKGFRLKAYDGSGFNLEDSEENQALYGKPATGEGESAWPQLKVVIEVDVGTHRPEKVAYGRYGSDEIGMVRELLGELKENELALLDRNLSSFRNLKTIETKNGNFLARLKSRQRKIQFVRALKDGSYLGLLRNKEAGEKLLVRFIEYRILNPSRGNTREMHRFVTSLLDEKLYPIKELITLYHERWEIELSFDEIKNHLFDRPRNKPFFRSQKTEGVIQEFYSVMILYWVVRSMMQEAAAKYDLAPRQLSFTDCVHIIRRGVVRMQAVRTEQLLATYEDLLDEMAATLLPERENRINPRVVKKRRSKFQIKRKEHVQLGTLKTSFLEDIQIVAAA